MAETTPPEEPITEPDELLKAEFEIMNVKNAELQARCAAAEAERDELRKVIRDNPALNDKLTQELKIVNSQIQTKNDELDNIPASLVKDEQDLIRQKRQGEINELVARKQKIIAYLQEA